MSEKKHSSNYTNANITPCMEERILSLKCMNDNGFDKEMCTLYFENYKNCQDFWKQIQSERWKQGISPLLPEPHEREKIKEEYFEKLKS